MKHSVEYQRLMDRSYGDEEKNSGVRASRSTRSSNTFSHLRQRSHTVLLGALILSVGLNFYQALSPYPFTKVATTQARSETPYAHLAWDKETTYYQSSYDADNSSEADARWDAIGYNIGNIALDYDYVREKGLMTGQEFPWDPEEKAVYFLSAYHSLHCLKSMRKSMLELWDTGKSSYDREHTMHCFEVLLNDVKCYADDTPLATRRQYPGRPGWGEKRQCRDWSKLDAFAAQNPSCWRNVHPHSKELDPLERYKYCPEGSPYNAWVHAVFGEFDENEGAETPNNW